MTTRCAPPDLSILSPPRPAPSPSPHLSFLSLSLLPLCVLIGGGDHFILNQVITGDCPNIVLVPIGTTTWYRANKVTATNSALTFDSHGLGTTVVHSTLASDHDVVLNDTIAATVQMI